MPRSLARLATEFGLEERQDTSDVEVTGITLSTQNVTGGDLYVGLPGRNAHGADFAADAIERGAVAVLTDEAGAARLTDAAVPVLVTADPRAILGHLAAWVYRNDELLPTLFAVTGTNGKTSVVYLIDAILTQLGTPSALSTTAERRVGDLRHTAGLTTPEATELHALLALAREHALRAAAIEVSAQALSRHRVDGVRFDVVGFTNLSHDHLDDYADLEEYFQAKLALFDPDRAERGVVEVDTPWGKRVVAESRIPITTLSANGERADWQVTVLEHDIHRTAFRLTAPDGRELETSVPYFGAFMAGNAALAIVMIVESGWDLAAVDQVLRRDGGIDVFIPGRTERLSGRDAPAFYLDYGHTPDAFETTLRALREVTPGRVIMLFGADGDRDRVKRPEMGAIAAREADVVIITDYHPRSEDPASIRAALLAGARAAVPDGELLEIPSPAEAVRAAIALAGPDDAILYAGPGHENYREVAGVKLSYSARDDARLALREAGYALAEPDQAE